MQVKAIAADWSECKVLDRFKSLDAAKEAAQEYADVYIGRDAEWDAACDALERKRHADKGRRTRPPNVA